MHIKYKEIFLVNRIISDIIAMTVCAVVGGAEGWSDVELFVKCKYEWFQIQRGCVPATGVR